MMNLWAAEWRAKNKDGETKHLVYDSRCIPELFRTRQECREWIEEKYGYIKTRKDLREEPFGWRLPVAVKVHIELTGEK
ncbi:MAG: hypothetical protein WC364_15530 [Eubacteriales bacterium]|jgi:hypothetical protein